MSVFSEQNARLAQGLVDAKAAIEAKKGTVAIAKTTPQIEEIVAGISTVKAGGGISSDVIVTDIMAWDKMFMLLPDSPIGTIIDLFVPVGLTTDSLTQTYIPTLQFNDNQIGGLQ